MLILLVLCLALIAPSAALGQDQWCWDRDDVRVEVDGSRVRFDHHAALLNCCPDPITFEMLVGDATLFVTESSESPCDCQCCYNLEATFEDVPPGPWNVRFRWLDFESADWVERGFQIDVPDVGQGYEPYIADQRSTGCLEPGSLPDDFRAEVGNWGKIKSMYR